MLLLQFFWNLPSTPACKAKTLPEDNLHESKVSARSPASPLFWPRALRSPSNPRRPHRRPTVEPFEQNFSFFVDGGFLGVYAENINRENMGRYNMNQVRGVGVTQVIKDSPAEKAGLRKDDVILRIDGENVNSVRKLNRLVSEMAPDHSVRVAVSRGGSEQEITATIGKRSNSSMVQGLFHGESKIWKWEGRSESVEV